uniref:TLC domain-containing protein n=1 Tax=Globisporangium ultimum (strain ATCC 200006 / CBS 805.95 / DAOM BR144) TaxID=431595 RepID=K3W6M4_GLOUD
MITEVLAGTWFSMCAVMLYSDPRLWIVLASSVAFTVLRVVVVPLVALRVKSYTTFTDNNQLLWSNTIVSMLHSTCSSLLAIYALACDNSVHGNYVNRASYGEFVTTAVSTGVTIHPLVLSWAFLIRSLCVYYDNSLAHSLGYFAYDLWDYVLHRLYIKSPGIVVHHVVILICYISALTKTVGVPLLSLALICELHSAFMHLRKLMSMSNYSIGASSTYKWVWYLQWATFLLARTVPHAGVTWLVYQARDDFVQPTHFWMAFIGMLFINALNVQLLRGVYGAFRKDFGYSKRSQDAAFKATKML